MLALRITSLAALVAVTVLNTSVLARDVPPVETSLLNVQMERYMAGIDDYVTSKSLTTVETAFGPVKTSIRTSLASDQVTIESALTPLVTFQYDVEKTQPGFMAVNGSQLTADERGMIAAPKSWDAIYSMITALCDPLKNADVTKAVEKLDTAARAALKESSNSDVTTPPLEAFLNELTDLDMFEFGETLVNNITATLEAFPLKFQAARAAIAAKLESGAVTSETSPSVSTEETKTKNTTAPTVAPSTSDAATAPTGLVVTLLGAVLGLGAVW